MKIPDRNTLGLNFSVEIFAHWSRTCACGDVDLETRAFTMLQRPPAAVTPHSIFLSRRHCATSARLINLRDLILLRRSIVVSLCYCRVSTDLQQGGMESQIRVLKTYCEQNNISPVEFFTDEGISGTKSSRPALDKMMAAVNNDEISSVIV
jgi:hypothetical protein